MIAFRRILHPTDFSPFANAALACALKLAREFGAELRLLHVTPDVGPDPLGGFYGDEDAFYAKLKAEAGTRMQALIDESRRDHVTLQHEVRRGASPSAVILQVAAEEDIDLIVMGSYGRHGAKEYLLGSTADRVVHRAPCHVMTVQADDDEAPSAMAFRRLLVPFDFSNFAEHALHAGVELATRYDAHLDVLYIIEPLPYAPEIVSDISVYDFLPDLHEKAENALQAVVRDGDRVSTKVHVKEGDPASAITSFANEHDTDLIVIATRGLNTLQRIVLGSVAERVVRTAACPVLTIRAPRKAEP